MNFMYLDQSNYNTVDFDVKLEIVSKDRFFDSAKKYISMDKETLLHRQALFSDILKIDGLSSFLTALSEKLAEYAPLMQQHVQATDNEEKLHNILYPTVYIELVRFIYDFLYDQKDKITAASLKYLLELSENEVNSDEYKRLNSYYEKNAQVLRSISSVTVGVNLNALLQPKEAGIVSLNNEEFKSGDLIDRIIKLDFENDGYHCIAPLSVIDKKLGYHESQQVNYSMLKAMGKILDSGLTHCSNRSLKYIKEKLFVYFDLLESLKFVVEAINRIEILKNKGAPLCFPKISNDRSFSVISLYDNNLLRVKTKKEVVPNTILLDNDVCCYILTGPNSGGKTVFINSLAAAQYYFQLGMPIPATEASLPICDAIFKISVEEQANVNWAGRFEKECISLSEVLKRFTKNSLALIDEAFTSTSAVEAVPIAANFISELCKKDGKCVFITHHHELSDEQPQIAECGEKIGYLHTQLDGERRTYEIQRGKFESNSYAQSIAKKYGLL